MLGRIVFSKGPMTSIYFWVGSIFLVVASFPAALTIVRHGDRINVEAFQWLLLGIVAIWSFWITVWIAHVRLHQFIMRRDSAGDDMDFVLDQAARLAYLGLTIVGFASLGLLQAFWRVVGAR